MEGTESKGMSLHWKVLLWMVAGVAVGIGMQLALADVAWIGARFGPAASGVELVEVQSGGPAAKAGLQTGAVYRGYVANRGSDAERVVLFDSVEAVQRELLDPGKNGEVVWMLPALPAGSAEGPKAWQPSEPGIRALSLALDPASARARWLWPFAFTADLFIALLKMLIVPLVLTSIVAGVAGVGTMKDLRRLGGKTFAYYMGSSLLAILVGQTLVNVIRPGVGAELGLAYERFEGSEGGGTTQFLEVLKRMVPTNVFEALRDNSAMLSIIFFALLLGYFITRTPDPHGRRVREGFESFLEVMMAMAKGVLSLLPYGVFALMVKVTAATGFAPFKALLLYMLTVALALVVHAVLTLPMLLRFVGRLSPVRWFKAMSPALMTAFSTSSSSMTLPVTMETVEKRGRVSNKVSSFTLPLGATINMDGTALYECIGVIFLAQYYATVGGDPLTLTQQAFIVVLALLASVGAAGIPSAGLVMMLTILSALRLPVEGAALLLAVDRPLDMLRTVVNVWSDSCGSAIISRSEGEEGPLNPITST